jgi:uncharacterized protein with PIN domain
MNGWAQFRFYDNLNDFLPRARKVSWIPFEFTGTPAVKDAIEAIGVPHPEVDVILVNGAPVSFYQSLHPHDQVQVYPSAPDKAWPEGYSLQANLPASNRFVLDVHLGKLAKILRLLGFDTCYQNNYSDKTIAQIADAQNRLVLTRDIGLLKQKTIRRGYWLRSQNPEEQLSEAIRYFNLKTYLKPFTRCLACNGLIEPVTKETVWNQLPPKTRLHFQEFFHCSSCGRVYWKGSHYERMQAFMQRVEQIGF